MVSQSAKKVVWQVDCKLWSFTKFADPFTITDITIIPVGKFMKKYDVVAFKDI